MHIDTATYLVNLADARGIPKTIAEATFFAKEHLRLEAERGAWTRDLYGNYKWASKKTGVQRRWHFQKQVLQKQEQWQGDWRNLASYPLIDWGVALIITAAKDVLAAQPENRFAKGVLERAEAARGKRSEGRDDRKTKKERAEFEQRAKIWAMKRVAWENWEELFGMFVFDEDGQHDGRVWGRNPISKERMTQLEEARKVYMDEFLDGGRVESDGMTPAGGAPTFASSDRPPLPPFRFTDFFYTWAEASNGHTFSVRVGPVKKGEVYVLIGKSGPIEFLPGKLLPVSNAGLLGEGYLSGTVEVIRSKPLGEPVLLGRLVGGAAANDEFGPHADAIVKALLALWEKILRGWGVPAYEANGGETLIPLTDDKDAVTKARGARASLW